jgi:hypothetical protein
MRPAVKILTWAGETLTLVDWAKRTGLPYAVLYARLRLGWPPGRILTTPVQVPQTLHVNGQSTTVQALSQRTGLRRTTLYARAKRGITGDALVADNTTRQRNPFAGSPQFREWVFLFIIAYKTANDGIAPSLKEIQSACHDHPDFQGVSLGSIKWALTELKLAGRIDNSRNQPRGIKVTGGKWTYGHS